MEFAINNKVGLWANNKITLEYHSFILIFFVRWFLKLFWVNIAYSGFSWNTWITGVSLFDCMVDLVSPRGLRSCSRLSSMIMGLDGERVAGGC